jgi:hypothetical protein
MIHVMIGLTGVPCILARLDQVWRDSWRDSSNRAAQMTQPRAGPVSCSGRVIARSGFCNEAIPLRAYGAEIASLVVLRWVALWADPLAMTAREFLAAEHAPRDVGFGSRMSELMS